MEGTAGPVRHGNLYAKGFRIEHYGDFNILRVRDPWQGSEGIRFSYVLSPDPGSLPDSLDPYPSIRIPVERVVCMSTTHVAMLAALDRIRSIVGISGSDYISNPVLRQRMEGGLVRDVGADRSLDYERIVSLHPDLVLAYGITSEVGGVVRRLGQLGIPVVLDGDYLEDEPLGKTEWIRFIAEFYGMGHMADSVFDGIAAAYEHSRKLASSVSHRPAVMTGLPWKDAWYIPGARSFAAAFIRDAGGRYLWDDLDSREATPVDLESVYARAAKAEFWINSGSARSLEDILETDGRLARFRPFREGRVYNNSARLNPTGGNDFWETGVMEPQLILEDLIRIFHPGLLPEHVLRYYERLQ